ALKVAEMVNADLFELIEATALKLLKRRCAGPDGWALISGATQGILTQLAADLWESELARWPDHGHTISPTLEMMGDGAISHGQAVGIDCAFSAALSHVLGLSPVEDVRRVLLVSRRCRVSVWHPILRDARFLTDAIDGAIRVRGGLQHWPVMAGIGQ